MNGSTHLSREDKDLLIQCLRKHNPELAEKAILLDSEPPSADIVYQMRDALIDESVARGFDSDWNLNEYGVIIERLIERLGSLYLWPKGKR